MEVRADGVRADRGVGGLRSGCTEVREDGGVDGDKDTKMDARADGEQNERMGKCVGQWLYGWL